MRKKQQIIKIGKRNIGQHNPVFIIAEAGVNHNGSLKLAKKMIDAAQEAGADAIKFQTFKAEELVVRNAPKANYQKRTVPDKSQYEMLKGLELSDAEFKELLAHSRKKKILFLSTPFDPGSAELLLGLGMQAFKIGSGELTNIPLLSQVARYGKPIILSTGMSTLAEVRAAVKAIYAAGNRKLVLLHCTSNYPTRYEDVNLLAMVTLRNEFSVPVGYSDHTKGIEVSIGAVTRGACVIEKHFTLKKNYSGPDHKASLEPREFMNMVNSIRNIEKSIGNGLKIPRESENTMRKIARKSIVALKAIHKGEKITHDMVSIKRPGTGISPMYLSKIIGKKAKNNIKANEVIKWAKV